MANWTKEDEIRVTEKAYSELIQHREDYIRILGKERYNRSIPEFLRRLKFTAYGDDSKITS